MSDRQMWIFYPATKLPVPIDIVALAIAADGLSLTRNFAAYSELSSTSMARFSEFAIGPRGKPYVANIATPLQFSLTHAHDLAMIAVADFEVGIDVEYLPRELGFEKLIETVLSPTEQQLINSLAPGAKQCGFLALWCAKEAVLKSSGIGIGVELSTVSAQMDQNVLSALSGTATVELNRVRYITTIWKPADDYIAAVASTHNVRWPETQFWS